IGMGVGEPGGGKAQELSRAGAHIKHRKRFQIAPFDFPEERVAQSVRITEPFIDPAQLDQAPFVLLGRVATLVEVFRFETALAESFEHNLRKSLKVCVATPML